MSNGESNYRKLIVVITVMSLTSFIMSTYGFGRYLFPMIVLDMKRDIHFTYADVGIIMSLNQVGYLCSSCVAGKLTLLLGSRRLIIGSTLVCGVVLLLLGFIKNVWLIGLLISILGICSATSWIPMVDIVGRFIHARNCSKVLGLISSGTSYGLFISGIAVPYLLREYSWEGVWITSGLATLAFVLIGLVCLSWLNMLENQTIPQRQSQAKFGLSQKRQIIHLIVMMFLSGLAFMPFQNYLIPYLREDLNFSVELSGRVWNVIGFLGMVSGFLIGTLADMVSIRRLLIISYIFILSSSTLLAGYTTQGTVLLSGFLFGLAYYGIFGLIPAYIIKVMPQGYSTSVFGISNFALGLGSALGNYLGGWLKSLTSSFSSLYISISFIGIFLVYFSYKLRETRSKV